MRRIGRYEIIGQLGKGAMGDVYRAYDTLLEREVALKTIRVGMDTAPEIRQRFQREARACARLRHRHIITVYDLGESEDTAYIAMELLYGSDFKRIIQERRPISLEVKIEAAAQICEALAYAHREGLVHRDIKPANLFLTDDGCAKVLDFGIARLPASELTLRGQVLGTPKYMAPEQVQARPSDGRADLFSVAAVLFEMITWAHPFQSSVIPQRIVQGRPDSLRDHDAALPVGLEEAIARGLAKDPDARYASGDEFARDLRGVLDTLHGRTAPDATAPAPPPAAPAVQAGGCPPGQDPDEWRLSEALRLLPGFETAVDAGDMTMARAMLADLETRLEGDIRFAEALRMCRSRLPESDPAPPGAGSAARGGDEETATLTMVGPPVAAPVATPPVTAPKSDPPVTVPVVAPPVAMPVAAPPVAALRAEPSVTALRAEPPVAALRAEPPVAMPVAAPPVAALRAEPSVTAPVVAPPVAAPKAAPQAPPARSAPEGAAIPPPPASPAVKVESQSPAPASAAPAPANPASHWQPAEAAPGHLFGKTPAVPPGQALPGASATWPLPHGAPAGPGSEEMPARPAEQGRPKVAAADRQPSAPPRGSLKPLLIIAGIVVLGAAAAGAAFLFLGTPKAEPAVGTAVVRTASAKIYHTPSEGGAVIASVAAGTQLNILRLPVQPQPEWINVQPVKPEVSRPGYIRTAALGDWQIPTATGALAVARMLGADASGTAEQMNAQVEQLDDVARRFPGDPAAGQARLDAARLRLELARRQRAAGRSQTEWAAYLIAAQADLAKLAQNQQLRDAADELNRQAAAMLSGRR